MNIKIVKLLGAICGALIVVLIAEWIAHEFALNRLLASINSAPSKPYQIDKVPAIDLEKKTEESYAEIVSRPLFIRGRKPVNEPVAESAVGAPGSSGAFDWQLNGVYTVNNSWSALFSREKNPMAKDNFRKLTINDDLDGWKLTEIHKDKVILEQQGGETKELLLRKAKPKTAPGGQEPAKKQAPPQAHMERRNRVPRPPVPQTETQPQTEVDAPENSDNE
ncbi:MAG: hypothetical protein ACXWTN_02810 [Methylosarcina sp.]